MHDGGTAETFRGDRPTGTEEAAFDRFLQTQPNPVGGDTTAPRLGTASQRLAMLARHVNPPSTGDAPAAMAGLAQPSHADAARPQGSPPAVEAGAATTADEGPVRALMQACTSSDPDAIRSLLATGVEVDAAEPASGSTALMLAAGEGRLDIMGTLLLNKADVEKRDAEGNTALVYAARSGQVAAVRMLLNSDADVNDWSAEDEDGDLVTGSAALEAALANGHAQVVRLLLDAGAWRIKEGPDDDSGR